MGSPMVFQGAVGARIARGRLGCVVIHRSLAAPPRGVAVLRRSTAMKIPSSLLKMAAGQDRLVTRRQALESGMSAAAVRETTSLREVRAVLCEVVQRRLTTARRLAEEFTRVDRRKMALARRALDDVQAGCRSAPECELRSRILTSAVLPEPRWNEPLPDDETLVPDGYIEEAQLVLEVESMEWHQFGDAPELTERRRARYASLGWRVYPVSPRRIRGEPAVVLAEIEAAACEAPDRAA